MRITRDKDGVTLKMEHSEYSKLHSFLQLGLELASNEVIRTLHFGPIVKSDDRLQGSEQVVLPEEDNIPQFGAPWAGDEDEDESESQEVWSARQHEKHSRRLDWLEGMYRALDKRVKIAENEADFEQNPAWLNLLDRMEGLDKADARKGDALAKLADRISALEGYPRKRMSENEFNEQLDRGLAAAADKPLREAEDRVRDYMKNHFSAATILGVVDAIRGR